MATPINDILNWFKTGLKPTQQQFEDSWRSFWHKNEIIPQSKIENLQASFNEKADDATTLSFKSNIPNAANLNDYATTGLYFQGSDLFAAAGANYPVPYAGKLEVAINTDFIYQIYHVYGFKNEIYYRTFYSTTGWYAWKKLVSATDLVNLAPEIVQDFNIPIGFKTLEAYPEAANRPGDGAWGTGIQFSTNKNPDYINQLIYDVVGKLYTRSKYAGNWTGWHKILTDSDAIDINKSGGLNNAGEANKDNNVWFDYNPFGLGPAYSGSVISWSGLDGNYPVQMMADYGNGGNHLFFRTKNGDNNTWNTTKRLWHNDDFDQAVVNNLKSILGNGQINVSEGSIEAKFRHLKSNVITIPSGADRWVKLFTTSSENNMSSKIECNMTSSNSVNGFTINIRGGYYDSTVPSVKPFIEVTNGTYNERLKEVMVLKEPNRFAVYILVRASGADSDITLFWNLDSVDNGTVEVNNTITTPSTTSGSFVLPANSFVKANNHGYTQLKSENIGIGTNNPSHKLVVSNNGNEGFEVAIGTGSEYVFLQNYNRTAGHYSPLIYDASVHVFHEGDVGVNTFAPKAKLHIADGPGGAQLAFSRGTGGALFGQAMNEDGLILYKGVLGPSVFQRWHQSGNTSIGTHDDDGINKLQVDGAGKFEGTVSVETPTAPEHAATKAYVDENVADKFIKVVDYYEISESDFGLSGSITFFIDATTTDITMVLPAIITDGRTIHFFRVDTTGHNVKVIANHLGGWNGNPSNDAIYLTGLDKQAIGKSFAGTYWQVQ